MLLALVGAVAGAASQTPPQRPFDFAEATKRIPKPREIWPKLKHTLLPLGLRVVRNEVVASDTVPGLKLRRIGIHFESQLIGGKRWGHQAVILMVAGTDPWTKARAGKVVVIGSPPGGYFPIHVDKYAEPIAARLRYPVMVVSNPGEYPDGSHIENDIGILGRLARETGDGTYNMNCQCAVVYIKALDAFEQVMARATKGAFRPGRTMLRAIVGGHSKRGRSATVAAAMDRRVAGVLIMGNEGVYRTDRADPSLSFHHAFFQDQVGVPVFYLGATNEDGYRMFNVNILQERLKAPMTVEMIPNYCHSNFSEIQYMDWLMWVSHVFDGRPLSHITDVRHERRGDATVFSATVKSAAKVQIVRAWYAYSDDPAWRDLMWYHWLMRRAGERWECVLPGKIPDAFFVEVGDIARGVPGYVSSLPVKLTDAPVIERVSRGSFPRLWAPR